MLGRTVPGTEAGGCRRTQGCQQPPWRPGSSSAGGSVAVPAGALATGKHVLLLQRNLIPKGPACPFLMYHSSLCLPPLHPLTIVPCTVAPGWTWRMATRCPSSLQAALLVDSVVFLVLTKSTCSACQKSGQKSPLQKRMLILLHLPLSSCPGLSLSHAFT